MPVREALNGEFADVRPFALGDLGDLLMLDTRLEGREIQVRRDRVADLDAPSRQLLGSVQESWLLRTPRFPGGRETVADPGQQVMFAPQVPAGAAGSRGLWDGIAALAPACSRWRRPRKSRSARPDRRCPRAWGYDLAREPFDKAKYDPATGRGAVGTEIVTPAVTSRAGRRRIARQRSSPPGRI